MTVTPAPEGPASPMYQNAELKNLGQLSNSQGPQSAPHIWLSSMLG